MSNKLDSIVNDDKSFKKLEQLVKEAIAIHNTQEQTKKDLKDLEQKVKLDLGLPKAEFKKVVKFVLDKENKLPKEIEALTSINDLVMKLQG
jgi:hypothetical protein